jgi:DNA-binding NarL/FixJ family response regulator
LILLDLGLPKLNGISAARQIRSLTPKSKILFLSQECAPDVVREALRIGAGFILKTKAGRELLPAIKSVILGEQFLSGSLEGRTVSEGGDRMTSAGTVLI